MVHAFVLLKTGAGMSPSVIETINGIDGIVEAHIVAGEFDIIAELDVGDVHDILDIVSNRIQPLEGILDTRTYIAFA